MPKRIPGVEPDKPLSSRTSRKKLPTAIRDAIIIRRASELPLDEVKPRSLRFLGLDLGMSCGFSLALRTEGCDDIHQDADAIFFPGVVDLNAQGYESSSARFVRFYQFLDDMKPDLIGYELVRNTPVFSGGASAAAIMARVFTSLDLLSGLKAIMLLWAEKNHVPVISLSIGEIKKRATGHGNIDKTEMIKAANRFFNLDLPVENHQATAVDNIADALFISLIACEKFTTTDLISQFKKLREDNPPAKDKQYGTVPGT